jgi:hypothetical protein
MLMGLREVRKAVAQGGCDRLGHDLRRQTVSKNADDRQVALMSLAYLRRTIER